MASGLSRALAGGLRLCRQAGRKPRGPPAMGFLLQHAGTVNRPCEPRFRLRDGPERPYLQAACYTWGCRGEPAPIEHHLRKTWGVLVPTGTGATLAASR